MRTTKVKVNVKVNVPAVVVVIADGLHVPVMPLVDVPGNAGAVLFGVTASELLLATPTCRCCSPGAQHARQHQRGRNATWRSSSQAQPATASVQALHCATRAYYCTLPSMQRCRALGRNAGDHPPGLCLPKDARQGAHALHGRTKQLQQVCRPSTPSGADRWPKAQAAG